MGSSERPEGLSYAGGRPSANSGVAGFVRKLIGAEAGATSIEYAMIASIISIVIVGSVSVIGSKVQTYFTEVIAPYLAP